MDDNEITLPPVADYRFHIRTTLNFIQTYIAAGKIMNFPYEELEIIINTEQAKTLDLKLKEADPIIPFEITKEDVLTIYAAHDITNKILISQYGEELGKEFMKKATAESQIKTYEEYRAYHIGYNSHMTQDIDMNMPNLDGLAELKIRLSNLIIE